MRKLGLIIAAAAVAVSSAAGASAAAIDPNARLSERAEATLAGASSSDKLTVVVTMVDQADLASITRLDRATKRTALIVDLKSVAAGQASIQRRLASLAAKGLVDDVTPFWIFNGLSVTATPGVVLELAARSDVAAIDTDAAVVLAATEINIAQIQAPAAWALGLDGAGVVVASLDTGVDATHPDLAASWRGGSNSWFDPYNGTSFPTDPNGHGTGTMSIMVGGSTGGSSIGVAPGARWIAAKIFNNSGGATATAIHLAFQWVLDPDGNPATDDAPDVVNNSWAMANPGCDLSYQNDINVLRAAGILPVFAAGNTGTSGSVSPANNPGAMAVGAVDASDNVLSISARGPSSCAGDATYPDVVAPGNSIRVARPGSTYTTRTGTSMAAPHVAGAIALLLQAQPGLGVEMQEAALFDGAVDLGTAGVDVDSGFGRIDVAASLDSLGGPPLPANLSPHAEFTTSKRKSTYTFNAAGSYDPDGNIVSYAWDFGDGAVGSGSVVSHVFASGTFTVTLTVTDNAGASATASGNVSNGGKARK